MSRLNFLDAGRGIAILGVIAVHTCQNFSTGFNSLDFLLKLGQYGVQLFYVISAFTMMHTLETRVNDERHYVTNFWIRRVSRIAVPFWAGIIVYQLFRHFDISYYAALNGKPYELVVSALLVQGFWPNTLSSMVPGGGSIATEVIFYLIFPLVFLARKSIIAVSIIGILCVFLQPVIAKPIYIHLFEKLHSDFTPLQLKDFFYHYIFNQLPVFFGGILLFQINNRIIRNGIDRYEKTSVLIFGFVFFFINPKLAVLCAVSVALLLALQRVKAMPNVLLWLGSHSYSLYLFHFAILNFILIVAKTELQNIGLIGFILVYLTTLGLTSLVSAITVPTLEASGSALGRYLIARRGSRPSINAPI